MSIADLAKDFAALCTQGAGEAAGEKYWADDVVSIEAMDGPMREVRGKAAVKGKSEWWVANHTVHALDVQGPYVNGDQFALRFSIDVTPKDGERVQMDEVGLYTVKNGKVTEERFYY